MKHKSIFFSLSLIFSSFCLSAQELPKEVVWQEIEGVNVPIPPQTHPRLYVRSSDLPALKERLKTPQAQQTLSLMKELSKDRTPAEEAAVTNRGFRYYYEMRGVTSRVQLQALDYLLEGDKRLARKAITAMLDTLQRASFGTRSDLSRASGAMLITGAMVYDWCYDQMKSSEKQAYIKEFIRLAKSMECGYPPRNNQPIAGHPSEWMIMRDMLSAGIAIYDEYPDMYNHVITMLYRDYIPARNYFYEGQNYHQGTNYVHVRFACDLFPLWILDKMGAGSIYSSSARFVLYDIIYRRRPDGVLMPAGDDYPQNRPALLTMPTPMFLASSYYKDEYLAYEFERNPRLDKSGNESMNHCLIYELLWRDYTLKGKSPDDLPLTRYSGTPYGWMIARTGWDANSVIAEMKSTSNSWATTSTWTAAVSRFTTKGLWLSMPVLIAVVRAAITVPTTKITSNAPLPIIHCWCTTQTKSSAVGTMAVAERHGLQPMTAGSVCAVKVGRPAIRSTAFCPRNIR